MRRSGSVTVSRAGATVKNIDVIGKLIVTAPNVTIDNVCVSTDAHAALNAAALVLQGGADDTLIEHSTVAGANRSGHSVEIAAANWGGRPATLRRDYLYACGECIHDGPWTVDDTYVISNGMVGTSDHYEDVYCSDTSVSMNHDTVLNPEWQTATVFCDTNGGGGGACRNHLRITGSLLAGGDFMLYPCGNASSVGTSSLTVTGNRFARCRTWPFRYDSGTGGNTCAGGSDRAGYFPYGGYFGVNDSAYCSGSHRRWAGNVWDDNGATVSC